jgi:hypothetical protein
MPADGGPWAHDPAAVAHYRLFSAHFDLDFIDTVDSNGFKLTILREPRARVVSLYDFWRSITDEWADANLEAAPFNAPRYARSVTFAEFIRSDNPPMVSSVSNSMARQLLGRRFEGLADDTLGAANAAFAALLRFDWFATTEGLSAAILELAGTLGASPPERTHRHNTYEPEASEPRIAVGRTHPTPADLKHLASINRIDAELYRLATHYLSREKRVRWMNPLNARLAPDLCACACPRKG